MATQGPNSPGTVVNDNSTGTISWSNPSNAISSNNLYAMVFTGGSGATNYLKATNFGFNIPNGSTINGILVEIEKSEPNNQSAIDLEVKLVLSNGSIGNTNKAILGLNWEFSDTVKTYGGANDLWGETLLPSDVNNSNFGVVIKANLIAIDDTCTAQIDHIKITVYYTEGSGTQGTQISFNGIQSITGIQQIIFS